MTLFTARDTLKAARRGISKRLCLCCGEWLTHDDFPAVDDFTTGAALVAKYGSMPCIACADDHQTCIHCGAVRTSEQMIGHDDGPVCVDCVDEYEDDCAVEFATARMIGFQWRAAQ